MKSLKLKLVMNENDLVTVKLTVKISLIFVAFSENVNFKQAMLLNSVSMTDFILC